MGKLIRASALVLLLACSANAGIMTFDVYQPPPPPPPAEGVMMGGLRQEREGVMGHGSPQAQSVQGLQADASALIRITLSLLALL